MATQLSCEACGKHDLSQTGYWSHLRQSKRPECIALYNDLQEATRQPAAFTPPVELSGDDDENDDENDDDDDDAIPAPCHFNGDAFGDPGAYIEDDFGQGEEINDGQGDSDNEEDEVRRVDDFQQEEGWEPNRTAQEHSNLMDVDFDEDTGNDDDPEDLQIDPSPLAPPVVTIKYSSAYPQKAAGKPVGHASANDLDYQASLGSPNETFAPFASKMDWEIAKWAKLRGPGSTAFSELLQIEGVHEALGLSFKTTSELNIIIDTKLPARPQFTRREVVIGGEAFEMYSRDIVECIRALWANPDFATVLAVEPERQYADQDQTIRIVHEMHTGKWWWSTQKAVEKSTGKLNITLIPIIISSDKTQLTTFRNKTAYPPSRQAQVLLGYLPTSKLEHITNKSARRRSLANLFHACVGEILRPLELVGVEGIVVKDGAGIVRQGHPILAAYIGDYPEQVLVTGIKSTDCPTCPTSRNDLGDPGVSAPRPLEPILDALHSLDEGATAFRRNCRAAGVKPIQSPFWINLPFVHIHRSITPDVLHQLYQGVLKHLIAWIKTACGPDEIDARCRRLPPNHHIRVFLKGISHLSRVTGTEHDQILRFLLGIIIDIKLPGHLSNARLLKAVRGILDFLYLAKYPVHTSTTLDQMDSALEAFHSNKDIFIQLGIRHDFNLPKLHFIGHYRELFEIFGTSDNFNTEYTERLHIDMAKDAYRSTNSKDEYPQMTAWLDRRERILCHDKFIRRRLGGVNADTPLPSAQPGPNPLLVPPRTLKMARSPSTSVPLDDIDNLYHAQDFKLVLAKFIIHYNNPALSKRQVYRRAAVFHIPFQKIPVYHRVKFVSADPCANNPLAEIIVDSIHVEPARVEPHREMLIPGRFDTALIRVRQDHCDNGVSAIKDYCIGRIRCVFSFPAVAKHCFPNRAPPSHLAYVEWFTPFSKLSPGRHHRMYQVSRLMDDNGPRASIIPLTMVEASAHLIPKFGPVAPPEWKSSNVLDLASKFYVNSFSIRFMYTQIV
ncbi:hypothetical protein BKA70DRAFT_1098303 [Coprinopsis sp. MPI-PUGE-AT-0042]|nr:hypothetical protein BKA70DRAFT_1098303 [Coprinopsis sp. MPI-PUGE-AT-0042]